MGSVFPDPCCLGGLGLGPEVTAALSWRVTLPRVAWAAAWRRMSKRFLMHLFHFLPNFLSFLSVEILWAGYKMG